LKQIIAKDLTALPLGRQGENLARQVLFDFSEWRQAFGPGTVRLMVQRPMDPIPYAPAIFAAVGGGAIWTLTAKDTAADGYGNCELSYYAGDALVKSQVWRTWVEPSLFPDSEPPDPGPENVYVKSKEIAMIKVMDREEYDTLPEKSQDTLYLIRG